MKAPHERFVRVSVCMATFNGARFVREQVESILRELDETDELVIVDDASTDDTVAVVRKIGDTRIQLWERDTNRGPVTSFEEAIGYARGQFILLSDQDDVWIPGRVRVMLEALGRSDVVAGNFIISGQEVSTNWRLRARDSGKGLRNTASLILGRRPYFGSAMGFRVELRETLLPIPGVVEAHDHWLAFVGNLAGRLSHVEEPVLVRRLHGRNLTSARRRSLGPVALTRLRMLLQVLIIVVRCMRSRKTYNANCDVKHNIPGGL